MRILAIKMQRIDLNKIPCNFEFKHNDEIFDLLDNGYFTEFPNHNLKDFMFGEVYKTFKFIPNEKN